MNAYIYFGYFYLLKTGIIIKFTNGVISGIFLSFSPIINFLFQLLIYIALDFIMILLEPIRALIKEKNLKSKVYIIKELKEETL